MAYWQRTQQGAALIISLIFMLILAMISTSALQSITLQERMAGNARDSNSAFQAAEAALRKAEKRLQGATVGPFNGTGGLYRQCSGTATECIPPVWKSSTSTGWATVSDFGGGVSTSPQYYIEELPVIADPLAPLDADEAVEGIAMYRITARGFGVSDRAMVVLRTMYRRE